MTSLTPMELEVAALMVESLRLEREPESIDPEAALYREDLCLDSIDFLELSVIITMKYGFQIKFADPDITSIFSSLRGLACAIEQRRTQ